MAMDAVDVFGGLCGGLSSPLRSTGRGHTLPEHMELRLALHVTGSLRGRCGRSLVGWWIRKGRIDATDT